MKEKEEKKLVIGADKSGFGLKEAVKKFLENKGYYVEDVGTKDLENWLPFYEVAPKVAKKIQSGEFGTWRTHMWYRCWHVYSREINSRAYTQLQWKEVTQLKWQR